jgi:3',5'-cyclic AMP phosphodiesterase CpdA
MGNPTNMTTDLPGKSPKPWRRKNADYVTIAHVSDTHFPVLDSTRGRATAKAMSAFGRDLKDQKIDLLCISGDIVGNPILNFTKDAADTGSPTGPTALLPEGARGLDKAFDAAKMQFANWCKDWAIDFEQCVFIVPGNHDLQTASDPDAGALRYDGTALDPFIATFLRQFRDDELLSDHPHGAQIGIRLLCMNSNDATPAVNFVRGKISEERLQSFLESIRDPARLADEGGEDFNICLLHHHPLPIAETSGSGTGPHPAAFKSDDTSTRARNDDELPLQAATGARPAKQNSKDDRADTFVNAGNFVSVALSRGVNLVLHGHQHRYFFKVLEQSDAENCNRMLVVGAGSLAHAVNSRFHYNVIRLYATGNIEVDHRVIDSTNFAHTTECRQLSMGEHRLRIQRFENRRRDILHNFKKAMEQASRESGEHVNDGRACVDTVTRFVKLSKGGDAMVTIRLTGVRARGEALDRIRIASFNAPNAFDRRSCKFSLLPHAGSAPPSSKVGLDCPQSNEGYTQEVFVRFDPPLLASESADLIVSYRIANAFEFSSDARNSESEHVYMSCRTVFPEHLQIVVQFPPDWEPSAGPWVDVLDTNDRTDQAEKKYASSKVMYLRENDIAALTIERPLPGMKYGLLWSKNGRKRANRVSTAGRSARKPKRLYVKAK